MGRWEWKVFFLGGDGRLESPSGGALRKRTLYKKVELWDSSIPFLFFSVLNGHGENPVFHNE